jgi:hypothetical protein
VGNKNKYVFEISIGCMEGIAENNICCEWGEPKKL